MAKDPNKSKENLLVNQLAAESFEGVGRMNQRSLYRGADDRITHEKLLAMIGFEERLENTIEETPSIMNLPYVKKGLENIRRDKRRLSNKESLRNEVRRDRLIVETSNAMRRQFSDSTINGQVTRLGGREDIQENSMRMMSAPYQELQSQRQDVLSELGDIGSEVTRLTEDKLYGQKGRQDPKVAADIQRLHKKRAEKVIELSTVTAAEKHKKRLGEDPESQFESLFRTGQKAEAIVGHSEAEKARKEGTGLGAMSVPELKNKEAKEANDLVEALKKLKTGVLETNETFESVKAKADSAAKDLKQTQEAIGAAGGGGGNNRNTFLAGLGGILAPLAQGAQQIAVNHPLQAKHNQASFANLSNQMFEQRRAALGGNMTELMLLNSDAFKTAGKEGKFAELASQGVSQLQIATGGTQAVMGATQATNAVKSMGMTAALTGSSEFMQGTAQGVAGGVQVATGISDLATGASSDAANMSMQQASLGLSREQVHVTGAMRQRLYDYSMGMRGASHAGGGEVGKKILSDLQSSLDPVNAAGESRLEVARIGTEQFAELVNQGAAAQGSMFSTEQVYTARNLERAGHGSMETNMGRMGQLATAGLNNPKDNLASVMEAAFSKGLDSSKALNMMVENTSVMAQSSQGNQFQTVDTTGTSASIMANLVKDDAVNKESAIQRAVTAAQRLDQINSGIGSNFADMAGIAAISKQANVSDVTAINVKNLDNTTAASLQKESKRIQGLTGAERAKAEKEFALKISDAHGLAEFVNVSKGTTDFKSLDIAFKERSKSVFRQGEFAALVNTNAPGYDKLMRGEFKDSKDMFKPEYETLFKQSTSAANRMGLSLDEVLAGGKPGDTSSGTKKTTSAMAGETNEWSATLDDSHTVKFKEMTKEARLAAKELGGVTEALTRISKVTEQLSGKLNTDTADDFRNAASQAATKFESGARLFTTGVGEFRDVIRQLGQKGAGKVNAQPTVFTNTDQSQPRKK